MERKKLELQVNSPINLELLFNDPIVSENKYGLYYLYAVKNGENEYSFFAPLSVHEQLKDKSKGCKFQLTRTATQRGKKLVTDYEIKFQDNGIKKEKNPDSKSEENGYYEAMLQSYQEATEIQKQFSAASVSQTAITLFIAKTKVNGFNNYPKE